MRRSARTPQALLPAGRSWLLSVLLAVMLVATQAAALSHLDIDSHPSGEACAFCVGLASLGAANVAAVVAIGVVAFKIQPLYLARTFVASNRPNARWARGPPSTL